MSHFYDEFKSQKKKLFSIQIKGVAGEMTSQSPCRAVVE